MTLKSLLTVILVSTCLAGLSACTTSTPVFSEDKSAEAHLFGDYLAGSYANYLDDAEARSDYYTQAFARAQDDVKLGRRALSSALTAGQIDLARTLAIEIQAENPNEPMSRAVLGAREFTKGRYSKAVKYFDTPTTDLTMAILMDLMKGWAQVGQGDDKAARETFAGIGGGSYFDTIGTLQTAKMEALNRQYASASENFEIVAKAQFSQTETALSKARAQSAAGDMDAALEKLKAFSDENGQFETGPVRAYLDKLSAGESLDEVLTVEQEAARALTEPAYGFFARNRAYDAAEVFLRLALTLDPNHDKAQLWLAGLLENSERTDEAMKIYKALPQSSDYIVSAKLSEANIYFDREEDDKALAVLEETNRTYPSFVTREALGRARLVRENYADALPIYSALVESLTEEELAQNPQPLYFRGICHERTGDWESAVKDFKRVLAINPDDADALNYLGYTWVDRGENLNEAFEMIRRAVKLEPQSGAIVDSLGWAHYKLGQYQEAKRKLEDAVELSPSSATIIDHLGDVYWKLGRYREAGYQWERALEFDPTDEERANIRAKLKGGLERVQPIPQ